MSTVSKREPISTADYLSGELISPIKHEFVDGIVYAMSGATANHNRIATNSTVLIGMQLRGKRCQIFNSDMKVRVRQTRSTRFYYSDVSVDCQPGSGGDTFIDNPVVVVEVLSESTRRVDEYEKREAYLSINSLAVYILLEHNSMEALVYRRMDEGFSREVYASSDAVIALPEIDCELSLQEIYSQVEFITPSEEES
jgi:Uma2 family endonuclease